MFWNNCSSPSGYRKQFSNNGLTFIFLGAPRASNDVNISAGIPTWRTTNQESHGRNVQTSMKDAYLYGKTTVTENVQSSNLSDKDNSLSQNARLNMVHPFHVPGHCGVSFSDSRPIAYSLDHVCKFCNKRFSNQSNLRRHETIHQGKRPFECKICGNRFNQKTTLKTHCLTHSGLKPFLCSLCSKGFTTSSNMKSHMLTCTRKKY